MKPLVSLLILVLFAAPGSAQTPDAAPAITIPRVATAPTLDDYLDGEPRGDEAAVTAFVQREPGDGVPASQQTDAYLSYDDEHLYVIFVARDREPSKVRATLTRREGFGNDDFVGLLLDTFHDRRRAYLFIVNPLGVQLDGVNTDADNDDDYSYDTVWQSEGRLTEFGYVVWMAIPFKSLRFPSLPKQEWGIALGRAIRRNNEVSFWPYITRRVSGLAQQFAVATGLEDISPGRNVQFIPYAAFAGARFLDQDRPAFVTDADARAGLDTKFVVKDAFTVDLTLNPDFSQVESDEPQVTINQRFEVFFPEKRPFFIENASYFQTPINLFFSRRIADPQFGARISGKAGKWALGGIAIDDRAPGQRLEVADPRHGDRTGIGVVRAQRDLPRESAVGLMASTRRFADGESTVLSVDGRYKLSDTWVASGQAAVSHSSGPGSDLTAPALSLTFDRTGRNWGAFLRYEDISRDFRAPLGFVPRVDVRRVFPFMRYTWFPGARGLVSIRPELSGTLLWDQAGTLQDWQVSSEVQFELKGQTELEIGYDESMERFAGVEFRKNDLSFEFDTAWLTWLELSAGFERGPDVNFFPSAGFRPFLASGTEASVSVVLKPGSRLRLDQRYLFTRLSAREGLPEVLPGAVIVDNHIWRSRASYQFSRNLSLRAIADYSSIAPDVRFIDLGEDKRFTADLLVTYMVNPWTALYAGFTDGYGNLEIDPVFRDQVRFTRSAFNSLGRQVFFKLSYMFRL